MTFKKVALPSTKYSRPSTNKAANTRTLRRNLCIRERRFGATIGGWSPLFLLTLFLLFFLSACNGSPTSSSASPAPSQLAVNEPSPPASTPLDEAPAPQLTLTPTILPSPTPLPKQLTICLGSEPTSLFPYTASSQAAQAVLAAIYDGPFEPADAVDQNLNKEIPIIVEQIPTLENGGMRLEAVTVNAGESMANSSGAVLTLMEGVPYRPSGCVQRSCELVYAGSAPTQMDAWVLRYALLPGLTWSDGAPLTADDSLYGYETAQALFPRVQAELLSRTASYTVLDERTVEWRGVPGYLDGDATGKFFAPLPRHAWGTIPANELLKSDAASRSPLGWGPYSLVEWQTGKRILLERNPRYFRLSEIMPYFDQIIFRIAPDATAQECDLVDPALGELPWEPQMFHRRASWALLMFGLRPADERRVDPFAESAVRKAAALCIDRAAVAEAAGGELAEAYIPADSPYFNPQAALPAFDPAAAAPLLNDAGWVDEDNDPATPRTALGASGYAVGTPLTVTLLVSPDPAQQAAAQVVQQGLASCGIQATLDTRPASEYLAAGPKGPVFGRAFDLALFAWPASELPPCELLLSREIPGDYPAYPRGWGGANAAGYINPEYDRACTGALTALPGDPAAAAGYAQAQALLAEDLPLLPLYWQERFTAARPGLCGLGAPDGRLAWWKIEEFMECTE